MVWRADEHRVVGSVGRELHREPDAGPGDGPRQVDAATFTHTIRTGRHMGRGRPILPPMPIQMHKNFTDEDLEAMFSYLQTIPVVKNRVPDPLPPAGAKPAA